MSQPNAHERWNRKWRRLYRDRMNMNGHRHQDAQNHADRTMFEQHGPRPDAPPTLRGALMAIAWQYLKSGGNMQWDWTKTLWKSVRGALAGAVALAVLSFFGSFDTAEELLAAGVPSWAAPMSVIAVAAAISWIRNFMAVNFPNANVVKRAGNKLKGQ